jgi:hypothetical protein
MPFATGPQGDLPSVAASGHQTNGEAKTYRAIPSPCGTAARAKRGMSNVFTLRTRQPRLEYTPSGGITQRENRLFLAFSGFSLIFFRPRTTPAAVAPARRLAGCCIFPSAPRLFLAAVVANRAEAILVAALPTAELLPLHSAGRSRQPVMPMQCRPSPGRIDCKEGCRMRVLRKLWKWWHECWGGDSYWLAEVDSHQWENKVEILRRLSGTGC